MLLTLLAPPSLGRGSRGGGAPGRPTSQASHARLNRPRCCRGYGSGAAQHESGAAVADASLKKARCPAARPSTIAMK